MQKKIIRSIGVIATFIFMLILLFCGGTAIADSQVSILKNELSLLNLDNPTKDLETNLEKGDKRFIALFGFTYVFPGIEDYEITETYGFRAIEGTSDFVEGNDHMHLIELARKYAEVYNKNLYEILKEKTDKE